MNNLTDLREQLQEDMIAYFKCHAFGANAHIDEVCQIVVDRVTELQDKWDILNEDDAMKNTTSFVSKLINKTIEG
jgi:hypothetical protein